VQARFIVNFIVHV